MQLDPSGSVWVLSGGFGTAAIYKFDSAGSLLLARSVVLDTTTNYANSFGFGGLPTKTIDASAPNGSTPREKVLFAM